MADVRQISAAVVVAIICKRRKRKRKAKEVWEREWLRRRTERGVYRQLLEELRLEDEENYRRYLRMDTKTFQVEFLGLNATAYVVGLRTSTRNMAKKAKEARGTQQSHEPDPDPVKEGEGTKVAISLNKDGQICIRIEAKPGAKQSNITDISADGVGVQIAAQAREGEANEELIHYLADILSIKKRSISLDKGSKSRQKMVTIDSTETSVDQVRERLSREALHK